MKTVTVKTSNRQYEVNLNNAEPGDALTPQMSRAARDIAFGVGAYVTVSDGSTAYRVTSTTRKFK